MPRQRVLVLACLLAVPAALGACGSDDDSTSPTSAAADVGQVTAEGIPAERCAANEAAGTITYLSGFDFAASASIVDVIVADDAGYYEDMCLDVELKPSFSTANYPLIAANEAQFASGGSYVEVLDYAKTSDADFVVVAVEGKTAVDALIVREGEATTLEDLEGKTIGVKGRIPFATQALLAKHGLIEGEDYTTVGIEGFDPTVHIALPGIAGFPGYKSNEPGILERAGIDVTLFDPSAEDIVGSFGIVYTNAQFVAEHPTAAQDFVRATMKGLADAIADPEAAANVAVDLINSNGNPNFLSPEGEVFRWKTEAALVTEFTPDGEAVGLIDPTMLQAQVDEYDAIGVFTDGAPAIDGSYDADMIAGVYDEVGAVIWPAS